MGAGCTTSSATQASETTQRSRQNPRKRERRMGNFTFTIYGDFYIENRYAGQGCRRTPAWETNVPKIEVDKKRDEFWVTQVDGNPEVWNLLRMACDIQDPDQTLAIVEAAGLRMHNNLLMISYDDLGHRYEIPPFIINEPVQYGQEVNQVEVALENGQPLSLVLRSVSFGDVKVDVMDNNTVEELKQVIRNQQKLGNSGIRMFYSGREIKDPQYLRHCGLKSDVVVQVMVTN